MPLLLDTSVAVDLIDQAESTISRVRGADALYLSVISRVELEAGVYRKGALDMLLRARLDALVGRVEQLPFTGREVGAYATIIAALGFSRRRVVDRMIAATALTNDLSLATLNPRDFRGIPGLALEDWST
ncbi:MAG TPA: PIN domain-containing protein [Allosphingosinicella sp.]